MFAEKENRVYEEYLQNNRWLTMDLRLVARLSTPGLLAVKHKKHNTVLLIIYLLLCTFYYFLQHISLMKAVRRISTPDNFNGSIQ